jgi:hypothetical protein
MSEISWFDYTNVPTSDYDAMWHKYWIPNLPQDRVMKVTDGLVDTLVIVQCHKYASQYTVQFSPMPRKNHSRPTGQVLGTFNSLHAAQAAYRLMRAAIPPDEYYEQT